jgi:glutamate mutase epsilon subunit
MNKILCTVVSGVAMTDLLERAISSLKTLPEEEQNAIASIILDEIEDERRWDEAFSRSPDTLAKLAAFAMAEYRAGKTQELDPETL